MFRQEDTSSSGSFTGAGSSGSSKSSGSGQGSTTDQMKNQAKDAAAQVEQKAASLKDQATEQATNKLDSRMGTAAEGINSFADALRQSGDQLRKDNHDNVAQYTEQAADKVQQFASYLQGQDVNQMIDEVERFARRQPMLFMGGAFLLGVVAARFLKASRPMDSDGYSGYQGGGYRPTSYSSGYVRGYSGSYAPTHGRTGTYRSGTTGRDYTGRSTWETGATGRYTTQQTPGFSSGSTSGAEYPEMDTGRNTQGYKDTPGTPGRGRAGITDTSVTGATGRGTGNVSHPDTDVSGYSEDVNSGTGQSWRDTNATE